jgi:hypothetical protein
MNVNPISLIFIAFTTRVRALLGSWHLGPDYRTRGRPGHQLVHHRAAVVAAVIRPASGGLVTMASR